MLCRWRLVDEKVMKRFVLMLFLAVVSVSGYSQSPVEDLIGKYRGLSGASGVSLSGFELFLARPALNASPLGPVASDVQKLIVLHMGSTSPAVRNVFEKSLYGTLGAYDKLGDHMSANGPVEVYAKFSDVEMVSELVVYNTMLYILNDIQGEFNIKTLEKLK